VDEQEQWRCPTKKQKTNLFLTGICAGYVISGFMLAEPQQELSADKFLPTNFLPDVFRRVMSNANKVHY